MIFLSIVVCSRPRSLDFRIFEAWLSISKSSRVFKIFSLLFFAIFVLNLFDNVIIIKLLLSSRGILKSFFTHPEARLFDDQVWIIFFFFNHLCREIIVVCVIGSWSRIWIRVLDSFTLGIRLKC